MFCCGFPFPLFTWNIVFFVFCGEFHYSVRCLVVIVVVFFFGLVDVRVLFCRTAACWLVSFDGGLVGRVDFELSCVAHGIGKHYNTPPFCFG